MDRTHLLGCCFLKAFEFRVVEVDRKMAICCCVRMSLLKVMVKQLSQSRFMVHGALPIYVDNAYLHRFF